MGAQEGAGGCRESVWQSCACIPWSHRQGGAGAPLKKAAAEVRSPVPAAERWAVRRWCLFCDTAEMILILRPPVLWLEI